MVKNDNDQYNIDKKSQTKIITLKETRNICFENSSLESHNRKFSVIQCLKVTYLKQKLKKKNSQIHFHYTFTVR